MADEPDKSGREPNLELPSLLGFGRKKRRKGDAAADQPTTEVPAAEEPVTEVAPPDASDPLAADPVPEPRGGIAPVEGAKRLPPVPPPATRGEEPAAPVPPPPAVEPAEPPVVAEPVVEVPTMLEPPPPVEAVGDTEADHAEVVEPASGGPETSVRRERVPVTEAATEQMTVLPTAESSAPPAADPPVVEQHEEQAGWPGGQPVEEPAADPGVHPAAREPRPLRMPAIGARIAALVTGAVVGLLGVVLAFLAQRGCEAVRGVGSCGAIGLVALLAILAVEVVVGAILLKAWRLSDPASTSFLGVGLAAVLVLLFLLSSLESVWMLLVLPLLTALTFVLSCWVTTTFVEGINDDLTR
jgi:hypothetical protein